MDRQSAQAILKRLREKRGSDLVDAARTSVNTAARQAALRDIGQVALYSAGVGVAGRGAVGLYNLLKRNFGKQPQVSPSGVSVLPLPVPIDKSKEEKLASWLTDFTSGGKATTKEGIPWYKPAMLVGGLAAGYGGWKAVDAILDARRKQEMKDELEQAKEDFGQAMLGEYERPVKFKVASDRTLGQDLDALFDSFEKTAGMFDSFLPDADTTGQLAGAYGMYAVPAALLAGYAAYSSASKRSRAKVLDKALKQRAMRRQQMQPAEMYATPVPVEVVSNTEEK